MLRHAKPYLTAILIVVSSGFYGPLVRSQEEPDPDELMTKFYRVSDLVLPIPNYSFNGISLPGLGPKPGRHFSGGGGFGGGGFFSLPPALSTTLAIGQFGSAGQTTLGDSALTLAISDLVDAITTTVAPDSWDDAGSTGAITNLGGMLLVSQTPAVHDQLAKFLENLRAEGGTTRSVTLRAYWIILEAYETNQLIDDEDPTGRKARADALDDLVAHAGARGQVTCFDGQTVHLVAGNVKSAVTSVIPVVGQNQSGRETRWLAKKGKPEPTAAHQPTSEGLTPRIRYLAQQGETVAKNESQAESSEASHTGARRDRNVGYQPVTTTMNFGALLQVTPTLIPESQSVVLDVHSTVTLLRRKVGDSVLFQNVVPLNQFDITAQQFRTTLRIPIGQPIVVGGSTLEPLVDSGGQQLYLVVETSVDQQD